MDIAPMNDSSVKIKPVLVMVRGLPGSGKSFLALELQKSIGINNVVVLDPDATDYASNEYSSFSSDLSQQGVDKKLHPYRYLRSRAYSSIESGKVIIWNQAFTNQDILHRTIVNLQTFASEHGIELTPLIIEVEIDSNIAKERVATRTEQGGHDVSDETFERFINDYSSFSGKDYELIVVNGSDDISKSASNVKIVIDRLRKS